MEAEGTPSTLACRPPVQARRSYSRGSNRSPDCSHMGRKDNVNGKTHEHKWIERRCSTRNGHRVNPDKSVSD